MQPILLTLWSRLFFLQLWAYLVTILDIVTLVFLVTSCLKATWLHEDFLSKNLWNGPVDVDILFLSSGGILFALQIYVSPWPLVTRFKCPFTSHFWQWLFVTLRHSVSDFLTSHEQLSAASGVMGALQLGSAALSAAVIGKISGHNPLGVALLISNMLSRGFYHLYSKSQLFYNHKSSQITKLRRYA